jgi:hypothetical protein
MPYKTVSTADGTWCLDVPGPGEYFVAVAPQNGWVPTSPPVRWRVRITGGCQTEIVQGSTGLPVPPFTIDLGDRAVCPECPKGTHCEPPSGSTACIADNLFFSCNLAAPCPERFGCVEANGRTACIPR